MAPSAPTYNPIYDLIGPTYDPASDDDRINYISYSPSCVIAVLPFRNPVTYSRSAGASVSTDPYDAVAVGNTVIIDTDILNCSVQQSKNSPVGSLNATLIFSNLDYLNLINPNDWIFAWIVYNDELKNDLKARIASGRASNLFSDGLKFVGRVSSIRKAFVQNPGGPKQVAYTLQGNSFKEFDSTIFYDPFYQQQVDGVFQFIAAISKGVNDLFDPSSSSGASITTYTAFTTFIDLIVGTGLPQNTFSASEPQAIPQSHLPTLPEESGAPFAYCVPVQVGNLLNKTHQGKPGATLTYADMLELLIGVQNYSTQLSGFMTDNVAGRAFAPDNVNQDQTTNLRYTNSPLLGNFDPISPQFTNTTLWTVLTQYLNSAVNEMYTCLRVNPAGYVEPTLVVRQFPFTSELLPSDQTKVNFQGNLNQALGIPTGLQTAPVDGQQTQTRLLEVPRWFLGAPIVNSADLGKTDAMHTNFVHVYGQSGQQFQGGFAEVRARVDNPPAADFLDIKRSGIRMFGLQTINCSGLDVLNHTATRWMQLIADFSMNGHLMLNGTINTIGIQAPIAPGDNVEFDGMVAHIEEVAHQFSMSGGHRHFTTTLSVSHGVLADPQQRIQQNSTDKFVDKFLFVGSEPGDISTLDPGLTKINWDDKSTNSGDE